MSSSINPELKRMFEERRTPYTPYTEPKQSLPVKAVPVVQSCMAKSDNQIHERTVQVEVTESSCCESIASFFGFKNKAKEN